MKTIKQIADDIGVPKQRVYRYIKKHCINEAHQENGVMYYDDAVESRIKQGILQNEPYHEAHHEAHREVHHDTVNEAAIDALVKQLEMKDKQIQELNDRLAEVNRNLDQAQKLHAMDKQKILELEAKQEVAIASEPPAKRSFWKRFFDI